MAPATNIPTKRLQQILDSAVDTGIITLDEQGAITSWSRGAEKLLGWAQDEMLGKSLIEIFPDTEIAAGLLEAELADAQSMGRGGGEGWRRRKDGGRIWAVGETTPIVGDGQELIGFVKILRDRTEQRQIETALRERTRALESSIVQAAVLPARAILKRSCNW